MKPTLAQTATFANLWKYWELSDEDLRALERQIMDQPMAGKVMRNTGGVRKSASRRHRIIPARAGVSGVLINFGVYEVIYFLLIFPKNEQPNLTLGSGENLPSSIDDD